MPAEPIDPTEATRYRYDRWAGCYERRWRWLTGGHYHRCRAAQVEVMRPGDRVLYAGVGPGDDAVLAARRGAAVTCVDISEAMLERVRARLGAAAATAECRREDVLRHDCPGGYDFVVVNNFLGMFGRRTMRAVLRHCAALVRPGGSLLLMDVAVDGGGPCSRILARLGYAALILYNWVMGKAALHPPHDYPAALAAAGLELVAIQHWRLRPHGPVFFASMTARRPVEGGG